MAVKGEHHGHRRAFRLRRNRDEGFAHDAVHGPLPADESVGGVSIAAKRESQAE